MVVARLRTLLRLWPGPTRPLGWITGRSTAEAAYIASMWRRRDDFRRWARGSHPSHVHVAMARGTASNDEIDAAPETAGRKEQR